MREITKKGVKPIETFKCYACGGEWITDEYSVITLTEKDGTGTEVSIHDRCATCDYIIKKQ